MTEKEVIKELENKILEIESEKNQILNENIKMKQMIEDINRDSLSSIHISHLKNLKMKYWLIIKFLINLKKNRCKVNVIIC